MSTKAEDFRYEQERSGPKLPKQVKRKRPTYGVDTAMVGVSATDRKPLHPHTPSEHAARKAAYALEDSATRPSRLSTRKASNRQKNDSQFRQKRRVAEVRHGGR